MTPANVSNPESLTNPDDAPPPREITYWKKAQVSMPLFSGGARIPFEVLDKNYGVIAVQPDDETTRVALQNCADNRRGGVLKINKEQYEALKKKLPLTRSAPKSEKLRVWERQGFKPKVPQPQQGQSKSVASAAVASNPQAASIPSVPGRVGSGVVGGGGPPAGPGGPLMPAVKRMAKSLFSPVLKTPASGQFKEISGPPLP